jgi:hypothetical protein
MRIKKVHVLGGLLTGTLAGVVAGLIAGLVVMYTYDRYIHEKEVHKKIISATKRALRPRKCLII